LILLIFLENPLMIEITQDEIAVATTLPKVFACEMPLRFADMDADQHVNNAVYYRYMEEARMRWINTLGLAMVPPAPIPVLAASACSFRAPLHYPGAVTVEVFLGRMGNSSVRTHYLLKNGGASGPIAAEGFGVSVWVDPQTQKPIALPEAVRKLGGR
jgi:acyl-CoA thioester hydrolase